METKKSSTVNVMLTEKLAKLNLANFVKNGQGRKSIYKFPAEIVNDEKKLKIFRRNLRKEKTQICLNIVREYSDKKTLSDVTVKNFKSFYAEKFLINDFSKESFTSVNEEKESYKLYDIALEIVKTAISEKK
jgi:hypothetical protein